MEFTNDGPGAPVNTTNGFDAEGGIDLERLRDMAQDAFKNADVYAKRAKDLVVKYPGYSIAGAVAAGYLFAKFARRR